MIILKNYSMSDTPNNSLTRQHIGRFDIRLRWPQWGKAIRLNYIVCESNRRHLCNQYAIGVKDDGYIFFGC